MTPVNEHKNDTKLLFAVAGTVAVGALAIALLAGMREESKPDPSPQATRSSTTRSSVSAAATTPAPAPRPQAELASFDRPRTDAEPLQIPEIQTPSESEFQVGPGENFVARGIETYEARQFDRSIAYWQAEIDARPQRAWSHYMLGLSLWKDGRLDEAAVAMDQSLKIDSTSIKTYVNLSRIQNQAGEFEAAYQTARAALELEADDPTALFLEGRSLFNLNRLEQAGTSLATSLAIDPDNGFAQNLLGLAYLRQDRSADAVVALTRAVELQPGVAYVHNNLGMAYELSSDRERAIESYRRAVELKPDHGKAVSNLARLEPVEPSPSDSGEASTVAVNDQQQAEVQTP